MNTRPARLAFIAICSLAGAGVEGGAGRAATDPNAGITERIRSADSVRVARVRDPAPGETGEAGEHRLSDFIIQREGRADSAWRTAMAGVLADAMRRSSVPGLCPRDPDPRRIRFAVQFIGGDRRTTFVLYLADRCFEFWSGRTFEGAAEMRDSARILALLKQAFPTDTTVSHLGSRGRISCADYEREHPGSTSTVQPAEATRVVPPNYPKEARKAKLEGRVLLQVSIAADGVIGEVKVLESVPAFDAAAIAAVRQWEFAPALDCDGNPANSFLVVPIQFRLH